MPNPTIEAAALDGERVTLTLRVDTLALAVHLSGVEAKLSRLRNAARGGNADKTTAELLEWVAGRLVHQHGENPDVDYIRACRTRAAMLRDALNF